MYLINGAVALNANPDTIRAHIPHAREVEFKGQKLAVAKHGLEETLILRNLGYPVPSPILERYNWPGPFTPFEHQRATAAFLTLNRKAFVLNEMRTGKTASAIWAADYLMHAGQLKTVLILCPKSIMHVWANEIFRCATHRTQSTWYGARAKRIELAAQPAEFNIINHHGLGVVLDTLRQNTPDLIIVDEPMLRNAQIQHYKQFKALLKPTTRLWLLTGTPTPNGPTDAWALARLVNPSAVPPYFGQWKAATMHQITPYKWVPKKDAMAQVHAALQPAIRIRKADCFDLPPIAYMDRQVDLSEEQKKAYEDMSKHLVMDAGDERVTSANAAVKLTKLLQICCGVVYTDSKNAHDLDATSRLSELTELIQEADAKAIVFVPFKAAMEKVAAHLRKTRSVEIVNGDTSQSERARIFTAFQQQTDPQVLVCHPKTTAHGLNLSAASLVVWYAPTFSSEMYTQANERPNSVDQKNKVAVVHLGATPLEWQAYAALQGKIKMQDAVLEMYKKVVDAKRV